MNETSLHRSASGAAHQTSSQSVTPPGRRTVEHLVGAYRVIERVGGGRIGVVYRAFANESDRAVALKFLTGLPWDEEGRLVARFREMLLSLSELSHPHILPVLDYGDHDGIPYVVTNFLEGGDLRSRLGRTHPPSEALAVAREIADALDYAHARGTVHGGLDPASVLYRPGVGAAVADFGLAPLCWMIPPSRRGSLLAGRQYLSPEQSTGDPATTRSDVWSFAAIVYELLTGRPPFADGADRRVSPPRPSSLVDGLPSTADSPLLEALSTDPSDRPHAAGALLRAVFAETVGKVRTKRVLLINDRGPSTKAHEPGFPGPSASRNPSPLLASNWLVTGPASSPRPSYPTTAAPDEISGGAELLGPIAARVRERGGLNLHRERPLAPRPVRTPNRAETVGGRPEAVRRTAAIGPIEVVIAAVAVSLVFLGGSRYLDSARSRLASPPLSNLTTSSPPGSWTMAGQNAARTAAAPESAGVLEGKVAWQSNIGAAISAPPVVGASGIVVGLADGRVAAFDPLNGSRRWEYKASGPIESGPALADGLAYVGLRDGRVVALDSTGGGLRWEYRTGGPMTAAPVAIDGLLYAGSNDGHLYVLDAAAGTLRWEYDAGSPIDSPPAFGSGLVLLATREGRLHILDAATGAARLVYRTGGAVTGSPVLAGGFAYVANDRGVVHALDPFARTGLLEWEIRQFQARLWLLGLPIDLPGPQPGFKWAYLANAPVSGGLAIGGSTIHVGGTDGRLLTLDAQSGQKKWQAGFGAPIVGGPIVVGDILYAGAEDGHLAAFDAASGSKLWDMALTGRIRVSPAAGRGLLFAATDAGRLYAVK